MAAEEDDVITFIFTGALGEVIPQNATRFIAHESVTVIRARLFYQHPNIVELICHADVERIEEYAFCGCPRLRRVIIPSVKIVENNAFEYCAVTYVECDKLERIGGCAFIGCKSLSSINMSSAKVVEGLAFRGCLALTDAKFGGDLESIEGGAFAFCPSLGRIHIPLKNGLLTADNIFSGCDKLKSVDLVEGAALGDTVAALLLEEWRDDMNGEINAINEILSNASAGDGWFDRGEKARTIREWIASVLHKIIDYKSQHRRLLNVAATSLMCALPNDIVMNNILPFLHLPPQRLKEEEEDVEDSRNNISGDYSDDSYDTSDGGDDDEDGAEDEENKDEESHDSSFNGGGHLEEEGDDDEGRKRQKLLDDNE